MARSSRRSVALAPVFVVLVAILLPATSAAATSDQRDTFSSAAATSSDAETAAAAPTGPAPRTRPRTIRISETAEGVAAPFSSRPAISGDGRYVAFDSDSPLLAPSRSAWLAVFVGDVETGEIVNVSIASDGTSANGSTFYAAISRDGRFVAYKSHATNLVSGDTNKNGDFFVHDRDADGDAIFDEPGAISTERVTVATDGTQVGEGDQHRVMGRPSISRDGRYVIFASRSAALVPGDTNQASDVFVRDRIAGTTERVSLAAAGGEGDSDSFAAGGDACKSCDPDDGANGPAISDDGRYVSFTSKSTNLVPGDTNGLHDVFVRDRERHTTVRVSVATDGTEMRGKRTVAGAGLSSGSGAMDGMISADGRYVTFESNSQGLVPVDQLYQNRTLDLDIFVHDRDVDGDGIYDEAGGVATRRVNVSSTGAETNDPDSRRAVISPDGRHIAFFSLASNLVDNDTNGCGTSFATKCWDVFIHDIGLGWTERVSVAYDGSEGNELSLWPSISDGARYVTFMSFAKNLLEEQEPLTLNSLVFVRDRGPAAGVGDAALVLDEDQAFVRVAGWTTFHGARLAEARDPAGDVDPVADMHGGDLTGASVAYRPALDDLLIQMNVHDLPVDSSLVVPLGGSGATVYGFEFGSDGRTYEVRATAPQYQAANGMPKSTNHWSEAAIGDALSTAAPAFELYDCSSICERIATLSGSYGTTGDEVWVSVPLQAIGAQEGDPLTALGAFTATGGAVPHDEIVLGDVQIPLRRLDVGIAPAGSSERDVVFSDASGRLDATSRFDLLLETSDLQSGDYEVWIRGCLGNVCGSLRRSFVMDPDPAPSTTLRFTERSETTGQYSDVASVEAQLIDGQGRPVDQAPLIFELLRGEGTDTVMATTGQEGVAAAELLLTQPPGSYRLSVRYMGDERIGGPSEASTTFVIAREDTAVTLVIEGRGVGSDLVARLSDKDHDATGIAGRTVAFFADGEAIGSSTTEADGVVRLQVPPRYRGARHRFEAIFSGDAFYESAAAETAS